MFEGQTQPVLRLYTHRRAWRFIVKTLAPASAACEEPYCECQTVWRSQDLNQFKYSPGVLKTFFSEKFVECNGTGFINGKWGYEVRKVCRPAMRWDESLKQLVVWRNRSSQLIIRHSSTALLPLVVCRDGNVTEGWRETEVTEVLSFKFKLRGSQNLSHLNQRIKGLAMKCLIIINIYIFLKNKNNSINELLMTIIFEPNTFQISKAKQWTKHKSAFFKLRFFEQMCLCV